MAVLFKLFSFTRFYKKKDMTYLLDEFCEMCLQLNTDTRKAKENQRTGHHQLNGLKRRVTLK